MLTAALAAFTLLACTGRSAQPDADQRGEPASAAAAKAATYVRNASGAVGLAFDNRGRLIYAQKDAGRIVRVARGRQTVLARLHVASGGEPGLLGLAANDRGFVWAYYTTSRSGCPNPTAGSSSNTIRAHCIWRFKPSGGKLRADKRIFSTGHPSSANNHNGGALHFGPDGALYLGLGDLGENDNPNSGPRRAQDLSGPFGKLLRLDPDSTNRGAAGNPRTCGSADNRSQRKIVDRRIFACGLRNPYSFDWDRQGRLWVAEAGDSCDELNKVKAGVNYGWQPPRTDCAGSGAGRPVLKLSGTPSGVAVPKSPAAGAWRNRVFYGVFADSSLKRFDPSSGKLRTIGVGRGRTGWDLIASDRYLFMSNGETISRLRLPGA